MRLINLVILAGLIVLAYILAGAVLVYILAGAEVWAGDVQGIAIEDAEGWIALAERLIGQYGWPVVAVLLSPLISWRMVQWAKLTYRRIKGEKLPRLVLDVLGWSLVAILTFWAWSLYANHALLVSLVVACLHTVIVRAIFEHVPPGVADILQYGAQDDKTMLTAFVGKDRRQKPRDDKTRVLTEAERKEMGLE